MRMTSWLLILILFVLGCPKTDGTDKKSSQKQVKIQVPAMPPGFESIDELGKFDVWDVTETAKKINKKTLLSANWSAEKEYTKPWKEFSEKEKQEFDALVESLVVKLSEGVKANGGEFSVERPQDGLYVGSVIGTWEVRHDKKYAWGIWDAPQRWRVSFNAIKSEILPTPDINVFISQYIIEGEK